MENYGIPFGLQIKKQSTDRQYINLLEYPNNDNIQTGGMIILDLQPKKYNNLILNNLEDRFLPLPSNFNLKPNDCTIKEYKNKEGNYYKKTIECNKSTNNNGIKSISSLNSSSQFHKSLNQDDLLNIYSDDESDSDESFDLFNYIKPTMVKDNESQKREESYNKSINKVMELLNTLENDVIL